MTERINGTIETQISEGNTLVSQYSDSQMLQTVIQNVPQVQMVLQNGFNVSSQINAPFVEVTSVNGMTGDVITEAEALDFEANKYYRKNTLVNYDGRLYWAKDNFTSGSIFDSDDWNIVEAGDIDWSDINNKPTFATVATSGSYNDLSNKPNLATVATSGSYTDLINTPSPYSLPVASNSVLGGIKVGDNLSIDSNGILSATASGQGGGGGGSSETILITDIISRYPSAENSVINPTMIQSLSFPNSFVILSGDGTKVLSSSEILALAPSTVNIKFNCMSMSGVTVGSEPYMGKILAIDQSMGENQLAILFSYASQNESKIYSGRQQMSGQTAEGKIFFTITGTEY